MDEIGLGFWKFLLEWDNAMMSMYVIGEMVMVVTVDPCGTVHSHFYDNLHVPVVLRDLDTR